MTTKKLADFVSVEAEIKTDILCGWASITCCSLSKLTINAFRGNFIFLMTGKVSCSRPSEEMKWAERLTGRPPFPILTGIPPTGRRGGGTVKLVNPDFTNLHSSIFGHSNRHILGTGNCITYTPTSCITYTHLWQLIQKIWNLDELLRAPSCLDYRLVRAGGLPG